MQPSESAHAVNGKSLIRNFPKIFALGLGRRRRRRGRFGDIAHVLARSSLYIRSRICQWPSVANNISYIFGKSIFRWLCVCVYCGRYYLFYTLSHAVTGFGNWERTNYIKKTTECSAKNTHFRDLYPAGRDRRLVTLLERGAMLRSAPGATRGGGGVGTAIIGFCVRVCGRKNKRAR